MPDLSPLETDVDTLVAQAMQAFAVPGLALAIVKDGKVVLAKGYGVRELGKSEPVTPRTVFAIASCTKAFTSTAIGMLVDEKKMAWDDPIEKYIDFWRFADHKVTISDLLSHRSGLPRNDAIWFGSTCSREDILRRASKLEIAHPVGSHYEYNNLAYTAAGHSLGLASGLGYEDFIEQRIFRPLGMTQAVMRAAEAQSAPDHATPHMTNRDRRPQVIPWRVIDNVCPTGGISASVDDLAKWVTFQLAGGVWEGERLVSEESLAKTRLPAIMSMTVDEPQVPLIAAYAMGWETFDQMGVKVLAHSGGIDGFSSQTVLLPRENVGFAILTNCDRPGSAALRRLLIAYFGGFEPVRSPVDRTLEEEKKALDERIKGMNDLSATRLPDTGPSQPLGSYDGRYVEAAYGEATFEFASGDLSMTFNGIRFACEHLHLDTFLLHAPWPQVAEPAATVAFVVSDGRVESAQWVSADWGIDRTFTRV